MDLSQNTINKQQTIVNGIARLKILKFNWIYRKTDRCTNRQAVGYECVHLHYYAIRPISNTL